MKVLIKIPLLIIFYVSTLSSQDVNRGIYHFNLSDSLYRKPYKSLYHARIALPILKDYKEFSKYCYLLNTKSYLFQVIEQYDSMEINNILSHAESLRLLGPQHLEHFKSINNLARIYFLKGKFITAKKLYISALKKSETIYEKDYNLIGTLHENLGETYVKLQDHELALYQYNKALEYNMKYLEGKGNIKNLFNPKYVFIKTAIANIYKDIQQFDESRKIYTELQGYILKYRDLSQKTYASFYFNYADFIKEYLEYNEVKNIFLKALSFSKDLPHETSKIYEKLSELYLQESKEVETISNLKKAIKVCPKNMHLRNIKLHLKLIGTLPKTNKYRDSLEIEIKNKLEIKSFVDAVLKNNLRSTSTFHLREIIDYYKIVLQSNDLEFKDRLSTYKYISHAMMGIVTFQHFQDSQFQLLTDIREIVVNALDEITEIDTLDSETWDEALHFMELGKSILYYIESQNLGQSRSNKFQTRITELNYMLKNPSIGANKRDEFQTEIIALTDSLLLNDNTVRLNLSFEANLLSKYTENKNIISYITSDEYIYICSKIDSKRNIQKIKLIEAKQDVCFTLSEECRKVSQLILPDNHIISNSSLTISTDGWLNTFPFDLLYSDGSQLINNTDISYSYSLIGDLQKSAVSKSDKTKSYFFQLPLTEYSNVHEAYELDNIGKYFNAHFTNSTCTKENFNAALLDGHIIHISSHAQSNSDTSIAHLKFAKEDLSLFDIYNLDYAPELVVLSSCNNELGEFNPGEGSNSLGRAFYYAGSKNIISSLWELNEKSTSEVFKYFYLFMAEGHDASKSLQLAKLSYLENAKSDREKNPYYWAGIISIGDLSSNDTFWINMPNHNYYLLASFLVVFIILFRKFRKQFF